MHASLTNHLYYSVCYLLYFTVRFFTTAQIPPNSIGPSPEIGKHLLGREQHTLQKAQLKGEGSLYLNIFSSTAKTVDKR